MVKRPAEIQASEDNIKKAKMATPMNVDSEAGIKIDEDLHSRQLAVYGKESMKRMANASVLIVGVKGLGVEVAKNVILAGVKAVALYDPSPVVIKDLGAQFYLTPDDVGKPTAAACKDSLQELNKAVQVGVLESLPNEVLANYQVVVCTSATLKDANKYDAFCRAQSPPIPFIYAKTAGVFGQVFCDFGPEFVVFDTNGEQPHSGIIAGITPSGANTIVTCVEEERLGFEEGDLVTFSEVAGMEPLNSAPPARVRSKTTYSIEIELDTTQFPAYSTGGIVTQYKEPKQMSHRSMEACMGDPGDFLLSDFSKIDRPQLLHVAFQALEMYMEKQGKLPKPGSRADIAAFMSVFEELNASQPKEQQAEANEDVLAQFASGSSAEINPMAAMFGGIVGQEAVKAISGKFTPMTQWFYFDSVESLPNEVMSEAEYVPANCRYDHQIAVFGRSLQARLSSLRVFLVGAGALGCEFLKNFALMGVACGDAPQTPRGPAADPPGVTPGVVVTDDDVIEKSNLSRQFLFRDWDIGGFKAAVAGAAAKRINPRLRAQLLQNRVSVDTEDVFNDEFWEGLDVVVNALDNVNARLYVDSRCVYFSRPLLESGTLGTKCNTQMVIPNVTENYGATRDPPEKSAPMCTLHSFPHNIDHCLTWARSEFEGNLETNPKEVNSFLEDPEKYLDAAKTAADHTSRTNLEAVAECLGPSRCHSFDDCIAISRQQFEARFHNKIAQLTYTFPEDAKTSSGALFWSPPKRFPRVVTFDPADAAHRAYMQASAVLLAEVYGVEKPAWAQDAAEVAAKAAAVPVERFVPKDNVKIETDPNAKADGDSGAGGHQDDESRIAALCAQLDGMRQQLPAGFRVSPVLFEKDDDSNFHMDLITALANMRARNYGIPEVEKLQAKLIAGRIIPAIATATALATGLVCLDLYKVLHSATIEKYRNTFVNLALPLFAASEPLPAKKETHNNMSWTLWNRWTLEGDLTVQEVLDWFKAKGLEAYSISYGAALLYNNIFPRHKDRLGSKLSELVVTVAKVPLPPGRRHFDVVIACEDDDGEDIDVPLVSIRYC